MRADEVFAEFWKDPEFREWWCRLKMYRVWYSRNGEHWNVKIPAYTKEEATQDAYIPHAKIMAVMRIDNERRAYSKDV